MRSRTQNKGCHRQHIREPETFSVDSGCIEIKQRDFTDKNALFVRL